MSKSIRYPHRCKLLTCKGRIARPIKEYSKWAYWSPSREGWYPTPTCPACLEMKEGFNGGIGAGNSYSRFVPTYICSECGIREAVEAFFWAGHCDPALRKKH